MKIMTKGQRTKTVILSAAKTLINSRGFKATSISDIIAASGVKKGTLYFHFSGKEDLGKAILEQSRQESADFLEASLKGSSVAEKLANYLDAVLQKHKQARFVGGCLIGNTALEMADSNPAFLETIQLTFAHWRNTLTELLAEGKKNGELSSTLPPEQLAVLVVAVIEGGIMMSRTGKKEDELRTCLESLRHILGISS
ncbi:MAG: TetR/AcrR family transcriptional regulator [Desulfopila sp.]|jgi:TetR/AcrR family transcriptional repressor of nem operon|nr:TetR/AcrR family transcriptional regulator [Desulfopila sp.]